MAQRATFVVDPDDIIRFVYVTDLTVGRNPDEVLRVLDALQTDELCPCNWQKGQEHASCSLSMDNQTQVPQLEQLRTGLPDFARGDLKLNLASASCRRAPRLVAAIPARVPASAIAARNPELTRAVEAQARSHLDEAHLTAARTAAALMA